MRSITGKAIVHNDNFPKSLDIDEKEISDQKSLEEASNR